MGLLADLKHEIIRLLKEDEEFRYAVAGLIGLSEILKRLDRHEEELKKLREDFLAFVREQEKRWEENTRRWEENSRKWEEAYKRFEAIENELKKLREDFNRFVELEERRWEEANKRFSRIELGLGALAESTYSRYVWEDLREEIRTRGETVLTRRRNALVDDTEIDLLIETDKYVYVIEVKIRPSIEDVGGLIAKMEIVERKLGKPAVPILVGALIGDNVRAYAEGKNVLVYSY